MLNKLLEQPETKSNCNNKYGHKRAHSSGDLHPIWILQEFSQWLLVYLFPIYSNKMMKNDIMWSLLWFKPQRIYDYRGGRKAKHSLIKVRSEALSYMQSPNYPLTVPERGCPLINLIKHTQITSKLGRDKPGTKALILRTCLITEQQRNSSSSLLDKFQIMPRLESARVISRRGGCGWVMTILLGSYITNRDFWLVVSFSFVFARRYCY